MDNGLYKIGVLLNKNELGRQSMKEIVWKPMMNARKKQILIYTSVTMFI